MELAEYGEEFREDLRNAVSYLKSVGCAEIYVFGSVEKGTHREGSDIDIAVRGVSPDQFFAVYGELMTRLAHSVDLVDLDLQPDFGKRLVASARLRRVA